MTRRLAPAAARNAEPIAQVLAHELPGEGQVLELASGTGEHALYMARRFPSLLWQPSDIDPGALASIAAWRQDARLDNLLSPVRINAAEALWPVDEADAIVCINMVHISPWEATKGLFAKAAEMLGPDAPVVFYGPYLEAGIETAPSNLAFDESLKARNPAWGLRQTDAMDGLAASSGFARTARHAMPANNIILVYRHI